MSTAWHAATALPTSYRTLVVKQKALAPTCIPAKTCTFAPSILPRLKLLTSLHVIPDSDLPFPPSLLAENLHLPLHSPLPTLKHLRRFNSQFIFLTDYAQIARNNCVCVDLPLDRMKERTFLKQAQI